MVTAPAHRAYLDHAATTQLRPAVREAYLEASEVVGNPTSVHASGRRARALLDESLESLAADLGVPRSWIVLTSGGTEADNLAIRGVARAVHAAHPERTAVAVCATDHAAVLQTAHSLAPAIEAREMPVRSTGVLDLDQAAQLLADGAVSVASAALVNNETGIVQDLAGLSRLAREHGTLVHTDAVQGLGHTALPDWEGVDLMSISGHKIGAPVGIGALIVRPGTPVQAGSTGGGQQRGLRSGTLDAAHARTLAVAVHETLREAEQESARLRGLSQRLLAGILRIAPDVVVIGGDDAPRTGHVVSVGFPGAHHESLVFLLDEQGVDVSAGSACSAGVQRASHVLDAMGIDPAVVGGALRLSFGWSSTEEDVDRALAALPEALRRARAVGSLFG
ncbi:cysteine desulfurase [Brachybacterium sp. EF45031]|uniref:cysteine desulfurase family protein n=1 Tax=Brachybacterium sillae TaxID=2810536 RepID=UPI00217E1868|nr:cysteine desulfurase family protein [Brachybacterium sillae]MCS6710896.1 cysteine desulfurase [Brachybacterium sillae]